MGDQSLSQQLRHKVGTHLDRIPFHTGPLAWPTHTHSDRDELDTPLTSLKDVGGHRNPKWKPTQTRGEHANSTQWPCLESFFFFLISITKQCWMTRCCSRTCYSKSPEREPSQQPCPTCCADIIESPTSAKWLKKWATMWKGAPASLLPFKK